MPPRNNLPPRRPRPVLFWIIAAIIIAAIIVAWIYWASDLGRGYNPRTNVPMTPGYAPATPNRTYPSVPANQASRPAPATMPNVGATVLPPPASVANPSMSPPASGGTH